MLNQQIPSTKNPGFANEANSNLASNAQNKASENGGSSGAENNTTDNRNPERMGSNLSNLNNILGLAGSLNVGYPSSYSQHPNG